MDESAITVRYAKALFSLAKEKDLLSTIKDDVEVVFGVCNQSDEFNRFLKSPVVKTSEKIRAIKLIFKEKISVLTLNFLELVTQNRREVFIPSICRNILALIRKEKNIKTAVLTTAQGVNEATLKKAKTVLERELKTQVELTERVNANLIGGVILRVDDKQYDASVATQLKKLKQELMKTQL